MRHDSGIAATPVPSWPRCFRLFAAFSLFGALPAAFAAGTATIAVSGVVLSKNSCKFNAPTSTTLAFGNIDPSSGAPATASGSLVFRCGGSAATVAYSLTHDSGLWETAPNANRMKHATAVPAEYLPYTLTLTPQSGTVPKNTDQTIAVGGSISVANFQSALMGAYADTVVVTVNP